jgi:CheY-like chemotaxis protein
MIDGQKSPWHWSEPYDSAQRVLLVDNDTGLLNLIATVLSDRGMIVTVSESPADAIRHSMHSEFHYIVTDYEMPGMNGLELTGHLRKLLPFAIIIGMSGSDWGIEFLRAGANDFLRKPFAPEQLAIMLDGRDFRV